MAALAGLALVGFSQMQMSRAATLADFGYEHNNISEKLAIGVRPLLVIFANFQGQTPLPYSLSYYSNLVFGASPTPTMNGYFKANSDGAFSLTGGAVMLTLPASQSFLVYSNQYPPFIRDEVWASNIIAHVMLSGQFNFGSYDANHDGHITPDELLITIVTSDTGETGFGGSRQVPPAGSGPISVPGQNYDYGPGPNDSYPNVAIIGSAPAFAVWCEETQETMGAWDIYGDRSWSYFLSTQSNPSGTFTNMYYLDPWNRLLMGWCTPRIESMATGGVVTISAAQAGDPTAPVILYDPAHGTSEYWILEYRTQTSPFGGGYDANTDGHGLAVWHIMTDSSYNLLTTTSNNVTDGRQQTDWNEGPPNLTLGATTLWGSNATTPALTWFNGDATAANLTPSRTHLHVRPFAPGDGSITVEILTSGDEWVDFNWTGTQDGTEPNPFNTLAQGVNAMPFGATNHLYIKSGITREAMLISKQMQIISVGGPTILGQ